MSLVEEKIAGHIKHLYFKDGALDYAIKLFEGEAAQLELQWQFKPDGELGVLPSRAHSNSALKQGFLMRRPELSSEEITDLTHRLKHVLNSVVDRVKAGEKFASKQVEYTKAFESIPSTVEGKNKYFPALWL